MQEYFSKVPVIDLSEDPPDGVSVKVEPIGRSPGRARHADRSAPRAKKGAPLAAAWAMSAFDKHVRYTQASADGDPDDRVVDSIEATCRLCGQSLTIRASGASSQSWTTCTRHMKAKHCLHNEAAVAQALLAVQTMGSKGGVIEKVAGLAPYKTKSDHWKRCVHGLTKFVARHNQALHLGDQPAFLEFMKTVDPRWPPISARTIGRQVARESDHIVDTYAKIFEHAMDTSSVALTSDIWSAGNQDSYLAVTAHYITDDWQMRTHTLGTNAFNEAHIAENIIKKLCGVRRQFGMRPRLTEENKDKMDEGVYAKTPERIYAYESQYDRPALTTDNGSNIAKAADSHFEWNKCICHCVHLAVGTALKTGYIRQVVRELSLVTNKVKKSPKAWGRLKKCQVECAVQATQRPSTTDALASDESEDGASDAGLVEDVSKRKEGRVLTLLKAVPTRWSSTFYSIQRALRIRDALTLFLTRHPVRRKRGGADADADADADVEESDDEADEDEDVDMDMDRSIHDLQWAELEALKEAMGPIRDVSMVLEGSNYVTCSTVLLHVVRLLYNRLVCAQSGMVFSSFAFAFRTKLLGLLDDVNQFYSWAMCSFLDGRHKELDWLQPVFEHPEHWPKVTEEYPTLRDLKKNLRHELGTMVSTSTRWFKYFPCVMSSSCSVFRSRHLVFLL